MTWLRNLLSWPEPDRLRPGAWLGVARCALLVIAFSLLERAVRTLAALPEDAYRGPSIALGIVTRFAGLLRSPVGWIGAVTLLVGGTIMLRRDTGRAALRAWASDWTEWEHGSALRVVLGVTAAIATWTYVTIPFNPYFDQAFVWDRVLLAGMCGAVVWRPAAVIPFSVLLVAMIGQLDHPLRDFPWSEVNVVIRVLLVFGAAHLVGAATRDRRTDAFVFVVVCALAGGYWWSGYGKLEIGWIGHRHLHLLLLGGYANGWATWWDSDTVVRLSRWLALFDTPLMLFTLVVEWGSILVMWRRWSVVAFLVAAVGFHTGVFAFTGMLFWKWMVVEGALVWFLLAGGRIRQMRIFTPAHFGLGIVLVLAARFWVDGRDLSWYDTPLTYTVRLTGIGASGAEYSLSNRLTAPYNEMFFLAPFRYLTQDPQLTSVMGATGPPHALADSLLEAGSAAAVLAIEGRAPETDVDPEKAARFDRLVASLGTALNERGNTSVGWAEWLRPPRHLWSLAREGAYAGQEPLDRIGVDVVLTYYDGRDLADIDRRRIRVVPLTP